MRTQSAYAFIHKAAKLMGRRCIMVGLRVMVTNGYAARNINHDMLTYEVVPYGTTDVLVEVSPTMDNKEHIKQDTSPSMGLANHASVPFRF